MACNHPVVGIDLAITVGIEISGIAYGLGTVERHFFSDIFLAEYANLPYYINAVDRLANL